MNSIPNFLHPSKFSRLSLLPQSAGDQMNSRHPFEQRSLRFYTEIITMQIHWLIFFNDMQLTLRRQHTPYPKGTRSYSQNWQRGNAQRQCGREQQWRTQDAHALLGRLLCFLCRAVLPTIIRPGQGNLAPRLNLPFPQLPILPASRLTVIEARPTHVVCRQLKDSKPVGYEIS